MISAGTPAAAQLDSIFDMLVQTSTDVLSELVQRGVVGAAGINVSLRMGRIQSELTTIRRNLELATAANVFTMDAVRQFQRTYRVRL